MAMSFWALLRPALACIFLLLCNEFHHYFEQAKKPLKGVKLQEVKNTPPVVPAVAPRFLVEGEPPYPTDKAKPIIYLIQMEGKSPVRKMGNADVMCITWHFPVEPCTFLPNSSWTQGRNYMWKKSIELKKKYTYYVFMDEDIIITNLTLYEDYLLRYLPPIGVPAGIAQLYDKIEPKWIDHDAIILDSFDAAFNAFHYDLMHASLILPYGDVFDRFGWWVPQLYTIYLSQVFFANEVVGFMKIRTNNPEHRNYPRGWNMTANDIYFNTHIISDARMRMGMRGYSWTTPGTAFPKPPNQRYPMSDSFLSIADSDSPYWKRVAEIRNSKDGMPPLTEAPDVTGEDMSKVMFGYK